MEIVNLFIDNAPSMLKSITDSAKANDTFSIVYSS